MTLPPSVYIQHFDGTRLFPIDALIANDREVLGTVAEGFLGVPAQHLRLKTADDKPLGDLSRFENRLRMNDVVKTEIVVEAGLERAELERQFAEALAEISRLRSRVEELEASPSVPVARLPRGYVLVPINGPMDRCFCIPEKTFKSTFVSSEHNTPRGTKVRFRDDFAEDPRDFLVLYEYGGDFYRRQTFFHCLGTYEIDVSELERCRK